MKDFSMGKHKRSEFNTSEREVNRKKQNFSSSSSSESKDWRPDLGEIMPPDIFNGNKGLEGLTWHFFDDEDQCLTKKYTFFGSPSSEKEILALVSNATQLDKVKRCIKKAYARQENNLLNTLVEAR